MRLLVVVVVLGACGGGGDTWSGHAKQIAVAGKAACALTDDGQVYCWGDSAVLQRKPTAVGAANECIEPFRPSPESLSACVNPFALRVSTDLRFDEISGSFSDAFCGRTAEGVVHCWPSFQFDCDGASGECTKSLAVSGDLTFARISGVAHGMFGIATDGRGYLAQIAGSPMELPGDHRYVQLSGGDNLWAGIDVNGAIWEGEIANGMVPRPEPPVQLAGITGATRIGAEGSNYLKNGCAVDTGGTLSCWGSNPWGELGDSSGQMIRHEPAPITGGGVYKDVASSGVHVCAVTLSGTVDCWGWSSRGQIGTTSTMSCPDPASAGTEWPCLNHPARVTLPSPAASVAVGPALSCALLEDHTVWCWGANGYGQLGRGEVGAESATPQQVQSE